MKVTIELEPRAETPFYYINFMSVGHSAYDFVLGATRVPYPLSAEQLKTATNGKPVVLEPTLQLVVPPAIAKGLMEAIGDQIQKYEQQFGKIANPISGK